MVASVDYHFIAFHLPVINMLNQNGYCVDIASRFTNKDKPITGANKQYDLPFERSPMKLANIKAYKQLKCLISENSYDIIHCHTPVASILTRLAARETRKQGTKVIYTAHGFHFYKGASLLNWLVYYPIEKACSYMTDVLITINQEDYELAKRKMKTKRIEYVSGVGIDTKKYSDYVLDKNKKRSDLGIPENATVVLSVGEVNKNKNHRVIISAISKLKDLNIYFIIAGNGFLEFDLRKQAITLGVVSKVLFLGFRNDLEELYKVADIFCFPSKREGLPVAIMEAMASGLPIVCSDIRGNIDLVDNGKGGFLCTPNSPTDFCKAIDKLHTDKKVRNSMGEYNKSAIAKFSIETVIAKILSVYAIMYEEK